jgi:hypothetical protein
MRGTHVKGIVERATNTVIASPKGVAISLKMVGLRTRQTFCLPLL